MILLILVVLFFIFCKARSGVCNNCGGRGFIAEGSYSKRPCDRPNGSHPY